MTNTVRLASRALRYDRNVAAADELPQGSVLAELVRVATEEVRSVRVDPSAPPLS